MCNSYRLHTAMSEIAAYFREREMGLNSASERTNLEARDPIRPTNLAPIVRRGEQGLELVQLRWDMVPWFWKKPLKEKPLMTNARSETVVDKPSFRDPFKKRRCLVLADGYHEWTGAKSPKTKWLFTRADGAFFCMPGLWDRATVDGEELQSFTLLTCAPGLDAANYHDRQPILLERDQWVTWLNPEQDATAILRGRSPALTVEHIGGPPPSALPPRAGTTA